MSLEGDWGRLAADLARLAAHGSALMGAQNRLREGAEAVKQDVQDRLGHYQEGWPLLTPETMAERTAAGYPADEPLLRAGKLRDAITVIEESPTSYLVGVPADSDQAGVARAQEYGTLTDPPRPFVVPAAQAHAAEIGATVSKAAIEDLLGG